jgi:hypothetical protein
MRKWIRNIIRRMIMRIFRTTRKIGLVARLLLEDVPAVINVQ